MNNFWSGFWGFKNTNDCSTTAVKDNKVDNVETDQTIVSYMKESIENHLDLENQHKEKIDALDSEISDSKTEFNLPEKTKAYDDREEIVEQILSHIDSSKVGYQKIVEIENKLNDTKYSRSDLLEILDELEQEEKEESEFNSLTRSHSHSQYNSFYPNRHKYGYSNRYGYGYDYNRNGFARAIPKIVSKPPKKKTVYVKPNAIVEENFVSDPLLEALNVVLPENSGLVWEHNTKTIVGTPTQAGTITFTIKTNFGEETGKLSVTPNPKAMWKNIPSDPNTPFYKPDIFSQIKNTFCGEMIASRVRGRSHAHVGSCCDDDFSIYFHQESGLHLLAVSDGGGSYSHSRYGSKLITQAVKHKANEILLNFKNQCKMLSVNEDLQPHFEKFLQTQSKWFLTQLAKEALSSMYKAVALEEAPSLSSLYSTLLIAYALPLNNGKWLYCSLSIGDGLIALWNEEDQNVEVLNHIDSGEFSGQTIFLISDIVDNLDKTTEDIRFSSKIMDKPYKLFLMTDGVSDGKFSNDLALSDVSEWNKIWNELEPIISLNDKEEIKAKLEKWLDFYKKGENDDRTLVMFIPN